MERMLILRLLLKLFDLNFLNFTWTFRCVDLRLNCGTPLLKRVLCFHEACCRCIYHHHLVRRCPRSAGARGVLRNHLGGWIKGFSRTVGSCNSLLAEDSALRDGLIMALNMGIQFLLVELDAKVVCDLVSRMNHDNLSLISDCRILTGQFEGLRMQHIYREANMVADQLARLGLDSTRIHISPAGDNGSVHLLPETLA
ncbi:hypothetical protein CRG98_029317 [Punica granatum]|uniref:RNase H type-1 domain-containing protein n=1 Tax=Punica granatum TaxID=22663 RepID=A0A2I0J1Y2_PUNGR|nr:hypothetical protein CRG98_029317 [Punica granatum]